MTRIHCLRFYFSLLFLVLVAFSSNSCISSCFGEDEDLRWARINSTKDVTPGSILTEYYKLSMGDDDTVSRFRSIFRENSYAINSESSDLNQIKYLLFTPVHSDGIASFPLIVWMHGRGEGEADELQHLTTLSRLFFSPPWMKERYKFFFLSVLAPRNFQGYTAAMDENLDLLQMTSKIIDDIVRINKLDKRKVSLVGASLGGTACWEMASRRPDIISSFAPIASQGPTTENLDVFKKFRIWGFQSKGDALPVEYVRETFAKLSRTGCNATLTEFESDQHDAWTPAFDRYNLMDWLLHENVISSKNQSVGTDNSSAAKTTYIIYNISSMLLDAISGYKFSLFIFMFLLAAIMKVVKGK